MTAINAIFSDLSVFAPQQSKSSSPIGTDFFTLKGADSAQQEEKSAASASTSAPSTALFSNTMIGHLLSAQEVQTPSDADAIGGGQMDDTSSFQTIEDLDISSFNAFAEQQMNDSNMTYEEGILVVDGRPQLEVLETKGIPSPPMGSYNMPLEYDEYR